jgi:hypothetical protein
MMQNCLAIYLTLTKFHNENTIILDPQVFHSKTGTEFELCLLNTRAAPLILRASR